VAVDGTDPQRVFNAHPLEAATGQCRSCGRRVCVERERALAALAAWGRLHGACRG
jgi:hypothetical protein